jgi:hypothetical protein
LFNAFTLSILYTYLFERFDKDFFVPFETKEFGVSSSKEKVSPKARKGQSGDWVGLLPEHMVSLPTTISALSHWNAFIWWLSGLAKPDSHFLTQKGRYADAHRPF